MSHIEKAIELNQKASGPVSPDEKTQLLVLATQQYCMELHEEVLRLRKELRTRNGVEND